jgi:hypothetical protein
VKSAQSVDLKGSDPQIALMNADFLDRRERPVNLSLNDWLTI